MLSGGMFVVKYSSVFLFLNQNGLILLLCAEKKQTKTGFVHLAFVQVIMGFCALLEAFQREHFNRSGLERRH